MFVVVCLVCYVMLCAVLCGVCLNVCVCVFVYSSFPRDGPEYVVSAYGVTVPKVFNHNQGHHYVVMGVCGMTASHELYLYINTHRTSMPMPCLALNSVERKVPTRLTTPRRTTPHAPKCTHTTALSFRHTHRRSSFGEQQTLARKTLLRLTRCPTKTWDARLATSLTTEPI